MRLARRTLLVGALALALSSVAARAAEVKEVRLDWATYNPVGLVLKDNRP